MTGTALSPFTDGGGRKALNRSWGELTFIKGSSVFWRFSRFIHHFIFTGIMWFSLCAAPFLSLVSDSSASVVGCSKQVQITAQPPLQNLAGKESVHGKFVSEFSSSVILSSVVKNRDLGLSEVSTSRSLNAKWCHFQDGGFNSYVKPHKTNY